jgi:hypothetical protein
MENGGKKYRLLAEQQALFLAILTNGEDRSSDFA